MKDIEKENEKLSKKIKKLEEKLEQTKEKLKDIKKEFKKYKAMYPPVKRKMDFPSFVKENVKRIKKISGQKKGHKGYFRKIPSRIDFINPVLINACPNCGTQLGRTQEIRKRRITDIEIPSKAVNTEYEIHRKYCTKCKKLVENQVPNALPNARFGINLMLLIAYFRALAVSTEKIQEMLFTLFKLKISQGGIINILHQLKGEFGDYYKELEQKVRDAKVKYVDETGWRIDGKTHNVWGFITNEASLYKIREQRSSAVPKKVLGNQKDKVIVCDGFSAYSALKKVAGCSIQLCWFHILKNSKKYKKAYPDEGVLIHKKLKGIYKLAKKRNHKATNNQRKKLEKEIWWLGHPIYKHGEINGFVNTLVKRIDELFRFTQDKDVEGDNNLAERKLRKMVIIRKISNGSRSRKGADMLESLMSIVETAKQQMCNPLLFMQRIVNPASDS